MKQLSPESATTPTLTRLIQPPQNIILAGPQGSGKNVYGKKLMADYQYSRLVMGDRLRDLATEDTPLGRDIAHIQHEGLKVDDQTVMRVVDQFLETRSEIAASLNNGSAEIALRSLYDGVPRFIPQKPLFDDRLEQSGRFPAIAVELSVSEATARSNIAHRLKKEGRRDDGDDAAITRRLGGYFERGGTRDMLESYAKEGRLVTIDAELGLDLNDPQVDEAQVQAAFACVYASLLEELTRVS